ncbi:hypothetical protein HYW17_03170 [Candidatus Uhrbacteria bacterium]|nr:hypothetical protein [Candidatus Uhrbacteria bacterium]
MSQRLKRILAIAGFVVIILLIGFLLWRVFYRPIFTPAPPGAAPLVLPEDSKGLPTAPPARPRAPLAPGVPGTQEAPSRIAAGGVTAVQTLADTAVLAPALAPQGEAIQYYNREDGKFYRVSVDGRIEAISDKVFFNVSKVIWAPDRKKSILEYPDGANILYDFETKRQVTLPPHWESFSFSTSSDQIAFLSLGLDRDHRWLGISSADGSQSKPIEPLGDNAAKVQVEWSPNNQMIALSSTGLTAAIGEQEILPIGLHGENFHSLLVNGIGFRARWSPDGERILYSVSSFQNDWKPELWIVRGAPSQIGAGKIPVGLNTWADKCAFGGAQTVYCAVPKNLPRGAGLYPLAAENAPDELWKINLVSGAREKIAIPTQDITMQSLVVTGQENALYFTDQVSGRLYKIDLK